MPPQRGVILRPTVVRILGQPGIDVAFKGASARTLMGTSAKDTGSTHFALSRPMSGTRIRD